MSQFQRMIAIPQEEYLQLSAVQNVKQPLTQQFYNLESQYDKDAMIGDPYKRLILQSEGLEEMKQLKDKMRHYITVNTPKPFRNRAQAVLESISPFIRFNERGEIYDKENNVVKNSRLEDLIQHAVRDRRRNRSSPTGWSQFLSLLKEHNAPKTNLNRETLDEIELETIEPKQNRPSVKRKLKIEPKDEVVERKRYLKPTRKTTTPKKLFDFVVNY